MRQLKGVLVLAVMLASCPALASFPIEVEETCPVGGETFTHITTPSYSTFGQRPDGKPYGSWTFPIEIPDCPDNRLVMYREFEADEIDELTQLVYSEEYKALHGETTYYRASWLAKQLDDEPGLGPLFLLMRAAWQVDDMPATKARYQREFAQNAEGIAPDPANLDALFLRYRVANAWRELGEFERAGAALDTLPLDALDVGSPGEDASYDAQNAANARRYLFDTIPVMRRLIARGETSSEPFDLIPLQMAMWKCEELSETGEVAMPERCSEPELVSALEDSKKSTIGLGNLR